MPQLKVRVVNVVDLMRLQPESEHPHGMSDAEFDALFTTDRRISCRAFTREQGEDAPEITGWKWLDRTTLP
jgi:phosphoketolase